MKDFTQYERDNHDKICKGGETQALKNLEEKFKNQDFIANFKKPMTSPNALDPSTTLSSPYLSHGSLSVRKLYHKTVELLKKKKNHSEPPESLIGQLYFRELFYLNGYKNENFDQIINNPICKQI